MLSSAAAVRFRGRCRLAAVLVLGVGLLRVAAPAVAADPPAVAIDTPSAWWEMPPAVSSAEVAGEIRIDGVPMQVREFRSALPPGALARQWQQWWAAQSIVALESRAAEWRVLSHRRGADLVSVQLRAAPDGGTEGYVALGNAPPAASAMPAGARTELPLRLPMGARVVRTVESLEGARMATQTVVATSATARSTLDSLARDARRSGWLPAPGLDSAVRSPAVRRERTQALWFVRGADELVIFVHARPTGALALLHHVRLRSSARVER